MFSSRSDIEAIGKAGSKQERDSLGLRGMQLQSFWLYVDEDDDGYTKHALYDGFWESWITLWMDRNVPMRSTCLDIGANHGYYSFYLTEFKQARVFAFEPQPKLAELIKRSEQANSRSVNLSQVAIADGLGEVEMTVPVRHGMNATISNQHSYAPHGAETIRVQTWALNDCFEYMTIDFIKVDAEGAEDLIWAGSDKFRQRNPNCLWLMEWRWDRYKDPKSFGQELLDTQLVTHVNFNGEEEPVHSVEHLATRKHEDWMLVLRPKN